MPTVLHVGCGGDPLPAWLSGFDEVRMDINPDCNPDIVASMVDMGEVGPFDAIYCSHALEHLYPHDVPVALGEFLRVLKPGGHAMVFVPDLEGVAPTNEPLFVSHSGPISGHDMYYGFGPYVATNPYMAHHTAFVRETLEQAFNDAGFSRSVVNRLSCYNLMAAAVK